MHVLSHRSLRVGFILMCFIFMSSLPALAQNKTKEVTMSEVLGANAVVEKNVVTIDYDDEDDFEVTAFRKIKILNKKGMNALDAFEVYDEYTKIRDLEVLVFNADGEEIKDFDEDDFRDRSYVPNGTMYSDTRFKTLNYKPSEYPITIEYTKEIDAENTASLPNFNIVNNNSVYIEKSIYRLNYDRNEFDIFFKELNLDSIDIEKKTTPTQIEYTAKNIKPFHYEAYAPSDHDYLPRVLVMPEKFSYAGVEGQAKNWQELGAWMYSKLLNDRQDLTEKTKNAIQELTAGISDPLEKAELCYHYMQDRMRYISVQVGVGGLMPKNAAFVEKNRYGDCKALVNYTQALLTEAGVPSYYAVVQAGKEKIGFYEDFASPSQGNHIILAIPYENGYSWSDCTSTTLPFGFIGDFTDDRDVLLVKSGGGELVHTPAYLGRENQQLTTGKLTIDNRGHLKATTKIVTTGIQYDSHRSLENLKSKGLKKHYRSYFDKIDGLKLESHEFINDKEKIEFQENIELSSEKFGRSIGKRIIFNINPLNTFNSVPPRYEKRTHGFEVSRGFFDEDSLIIDLPEGYTIEALPDNVEIKNEFGELSLSVSEKGPNQLLVQRRFFLKPNRYESTAYAKFRNFLKQVVAASKAKAALIKI